jgi:hypothetical protein
MAKIGPKLWYLQDYRSLLRFVFPLIFYINCTTFLNIFFFFLSSFSFFFFLFSSSSVFLFFFFFFYLFFFFFCCCCLVEIINLKSREYRVKRIISKSEPLPYKPTGDTDPHSNQKVNPLVVLSSEVISATFNKRCLLLRAFLSLQCCIFFCNPFGTECWYAEVSSVYSCVYITCLGEN